MIRLAVALCCLLAASRAAAQPAPPSPDAEFDLSGAIAEGPPMTADRAAALAVESAPTMDEARALSRASEASVARARAAMLPRLELTASYVHIDGFPDGEIAIGGDPETLAMARMLAESVSDPAARTLWINSIDQQANGTATISIPRNRYDLGARLTWPVSDLFFAMMPALDAAQAGARAREHQLEASQAQVRRSAREAYYQLARARGGLAVAMQAQRQAEQVRTEVEAAVRAGFSTEADRLDAEARVASTAQAVASARAGVQIADAALRALTGDDDGAVYGIAEPLLEEEPPEPAALDRLTETALDRRPEIAAIRESLDAQRAANRASDAAGYPHLALFAGASYANPNRYVVPPTPEFQPSWEVGATLTWSPNDSLDALHHGQGLSAEAEATEARLAQLERAVRLEVVQSRAQLVAARESLQAARTAREAAEAAFESRLAALQAGETALGDLLVAEGRLDAARLAELDAAVKVRLADTALTYAIGG